MDAPYCVNDLELTLLLWRLYSPKYDNRTFIRDEEIIAVKSLEENINYHTDWRLDEDTCKQKLAELVDPEKQPHQLVKKEIPKKRVTIKEFKSNFSELYNEQYRKKDENKELVLTHFSNISVDCGGERERCWIDETFGIEINPIFNSRKKQIDPEYARELELLCGILSAAMDQRDVWSACRLLQMIAPETLPKLRRMASDKGMNIIQTLFSCTLDAGIEGTSCDGFSSKDSHILQSFDKTVDEIQEHAHSASDPKFAASQIIQSAARFAQTLEEFRNKSNRIKTASRILNLQLAIVNNLHKSLLEAVENDYQEESKYIVPTHVLLRSLFDRIYCSGVIEAAKETMTPAFKTPSTAPKKTPKSVQKVTPRVEETKENEDEQKTPTAPRNTLGLFLNNSTPTPIRPPIPEEEQLENLIDNIEEDPDSEEEKIEDEFEEKKNPKRRQDGTPEARPAKSLRRSRETTKMKKKQVLPSNQKTLLSFFSNK